MPVSFGAAKAMWEAQRGDDIDKWLQRRRDMHVRYSEGWEALEGALTDYRLHADRGKPLHRSVSENPGCAATQAYGPTGCT